MPRIEIIDQYPIECIIGALFCLTMAFIGIITGYGWKKSWNKVKWIFRE